MSFPWNDRAWCEVGDLLQDAVTGDDRVLAPDLFWWRVDRLWRYVPENLEPDHSFEWVVVHKGELGAIPRRFLEAVVATMRPVLANEVFVVFSAGDRREAINPASSNVVALVAQLARLPVAPTDRHPAVDDPIFGMTPVVRRFSTMTSAEARAAQDEWFRGGGYRYPTLRDQTYVREVRHHRDAVLTEAAGRVILDLCCGASAAGRLPVGGTLVRSDFSGVALAQAARGDAGEHGVTHLMCDASAVAVADRSCDVVLFLDSIEHVFEPESVVREAGRILRPGGDLLLTFSNRNSLNQILTRKLGYPEFVTNEQHVREFTLDEIRRMLDGGGMEIISTAGIELRPYWGVPGVDPIVRDAIDDDEEVVEILRELGVRAGAEYAYVGVVRARKRV